MKYIPKLYYTFWINLLLIGWSQIGNAQAPDWQIIPSDFQYTMTVTGIGLYQCDTTADATNMVAAFINGECRGVQSFNTEVKGKYLAYLTIYDNESEGNEVTFKLYNSATNEVFEEVFPITFIENSSMGNANTPHLFQTDFILTDIILPHDTIYDFNITGDTITEILSLNEAGDLTVQMIDFIDDSLGVDNQYFSISGNQLVLEEDVDFKNKKSYQIHLIAITTAGCEFRKSFLIEVINTNVPPTGLTVNTIDFNENEPLNTVITTLEALDETPNDVHTFTLVGGEEFWPDNSQFQINGIDFENVEVFNYEEKEFYYLQIEIEDKTGNTFVDTLQVVVKDVIEFDDLKAANLVTPNEDGYNDFLEIPNVYLFADYQLTIYNDLGNIVFSVDRGYDNTWSGQSNKKGRQLSTATYYYILRDNQNPSNQFKGSIHLYQNSKF